MREEIVTKGELAVKAVDVHKMFGENHVLKGVSLDVAKGSISTIIGPSGSGKSTFLRALNQLETIDGGAIYIQGEMLGYEVRDNGKVYCLSEQKIAKQRRKLGMVFQRFNLFPHMSVLENVMFAPISVNKVDRQTAKREAIELLERVGLSEQIEQYPSTLSGGQAQRVAIARALAMKPEIMLFDEPTSALDPELVAEVLKVIEELARSKTTMVIVTHEIEFAKKISDEIVFMAQGRIVEKGTPKEVLDNPKESRTKDFLSHIL
jgi:polar amino acid transport system ATP-binding protein